MFENISHALSNIVTQTQAHWALLLGTLGLLIIIHLLTVASQYRLLALGIYPRHPAGLLGIAFSPFLHGNFNHLFFNAIPLFVLMDFMVIYSPKTWAMATILIAFIGGLLTWIFGRKAIHVGASGVITGYWGYLVFNMYQRADVTSIILGVVCVYYFAGIFFGIIPLRSKSTSWEGHLFGLIAGIAAAWIIAYPPAYQLLAQWLP